MQIACPNCEAKLSLGKIKPGRFQPKCKHCGEPFIIRVSEDDPPKVRIGKLKKNPPASPNAPRTKAGEVTSKQSKPSPSRDVEATVDSPLATVADKNEPLATGPRQSPLASPTRAPDASAKSAGATKTPDATLDQTVDPDSASQTGGMSGAGLSGPSSEPASVSAGRGSTSGGRSGGAIVSQGRPASDAKTPAPNSDSSDEIGQIPQRLGGYKILRILGRGAMGAVYQAQQISLDRNVALKTIRSRLAQNPASLARFTREAYAAAQLTHHNVVQIYDFGEDNGQHYFSMEWVRGGTLSELVQEKGPLDPKLAASYVLQAARGLQFAHRNGMVHRDVKPANLLLSDEGVVKVADLGLVKIPDWVETETEVGPSSVSGVQSVSGIQSGTHVTMQGTAVGTPAYMAPEQSTDATSVDHRADIYSLGCSLFYLLAGRAPFDGSMVSEVMEMHARKPVPNLAEINSRLPRQLIEIVNRCMAKQPSNRYESVSKMIDDLESFLGLSQEGKFTATSNQADQWEELVRRFNAAQPLARLTAPVFYGFTIACTLLAFVVPFVSIGWVGFAPSVWIVAVVTALVLGAPGGKSAMVHSIRRWLGTLNGFDYALASFVAIVAAVVGVVAGLTLGVIAGSVLGGIAGVAFHFGLVSPSRKGIQEPIENAEKFIRDLRISGADEDGLRNFLARYAGKNWEPIYETLFGYAALKAAKQRLSGDPSFVAGVSRSSLRDRVCAKFDTMAREKTERRDQAKLAKIEQKGLVSEGLSASEARERSWQMAAAWMQAAKLAAPTSENDEAAAHAKRERIKADLAEARSGKYRQKKDPLAPVKLALSGYTRVLAGCALLAFFAIWAQSTGLIDAIRGGDFDWMSFGKSVGDTKNSQGLNPVSIGAAGFLMILSAFVSGWRMTPFAVTATIVIIFGTAFGIPPIAVVPAWLVAIGAGIIIYVPGILIGETKASA